MINILYSGNEHEALVLAITKRPQRYPQITGTIWTNLAQMNWMKCSWLHCGTVELVLFEIELGHTK